VVKCHNMQSRCMFGHVVLFLDRVISDFWVQTCGLCCAQMNATEIRRMKRLLSSAVVEEQLCGLCVASYAAASFKTGREPHLRRLVSAFCSASSLDYLLRVLQASLGDHSRLILTAAVDCIGMLGLVQEDRQLFTQVLRNVRRRRTFGGLNPVLPWCPLRRWK